MAVLVPDRALAIGERRVAGCARASGTAEQACRNRAAGISRVSVVRLDVVIAARR